MAQKEVNIENQYTHKKLITMTKETYIQKFSKEDAPGWLAIDQKLSEITFLQMIGITDLESKRITNSEDVVGEIKKMISEMKKENPLFITDLTRTKQFL